MYICKARCHCRLLERMNRTRWRFNLFDCSFRIVVWSVYSEGFTVFLPRQSQDFWHRHFVCDFFLKMFCTFSTLRVYPEVISMFCVSLACTESFNIVVYRLEAEHYELLARSFIQTVWSIPPTKIVLSVIFFWGACAVLCAIPVKEFRHEHAPHLNSSKDAPPCFIFMCIAC